MAGVQRFQGKGSAVQGMPIPVRTSDQIADDQKIAMHAAFGVMSSAGVPVPSNPIGNAIAGQPVVAATRIKGNGFNPLTNLKFR